MSIPGDRAGISNPVAKARAASHMESGQEDSGGTDYVMTCGLYTGAWTPCHHMVTGDFVGITT